MGQSAWPFAFGALSDLPTVPSMAALALSVAEDPDSTASDLLRVIMSDPPVAARVLRVANSVYFKRGGGEVTDLQTAIVRLGFSNVRNLLMGVSVIRSFDAYFVGAPLTREDFWIHSIAVGVLASRMAGRSENLCSSTAFVAGLVHDLGKLLLDRHARAAWNRSLAVARERRVPLCEAERETLGADHAAVTGALLAAWRFPSEISEPVRWHHDPPSCPEAHRLHAYLLQAADSVASSRRIGSGGDEHPEALSRDCLQALEMGERDVEEAVLSLEGEPLLRLLLPV